MPRPGKHCCPAVKTQHGSIFELARRQLLRADDAWSSRYFEAEKHARSDPIDLQRRLRNTPTSRVEHPTRMSSRYTSFGSSNLFSRLVSIGKRSLNILIAFKFYFGVFSSDVLYSLRYLMVINNCTMYSHVLDLSSHLLGKRSSKILIVFQFHSGVFFHSGVYRSLIYF